MAEPTIERGSRVDERIERISRWTAARLTRRSFFHRASQVAMMVAAGPVVATILARQADARVCGQSGVTPKCETFDCNGIDDVWGWCWYANDGCLMDQWMSGENGLDLCGIDILSTTDEHFLRAAEN